MVADSRVSMSDLMEERQSLCWLAEKSWWTQGLETVCEKRGLHSYREQCSRLRVYIAPLETPLQQ